MHSRSQEALFPHVRNSEHTRIAQAMVLFGLREGAFNRFFPPAVNPLATLRFCKGNDPVQRSLPHMPLHHLPAHTRPKAFSTPCTPLADFTLATVLPVSFPGRVLPCEPLLLRTDVFVALRVVAEAVLPVVCAFVCVPPVADYPLYSLPLQQVRDPRVVISRVQSHVPGQRAQSCFDFVEDLGQRSYVVDVCRLHMYIYNHVALAVHRAVLAVIKPVRFPLPALLAALRIRRALHPLRASAAPVLTVFPLKRLLPQFFPLLVHLRVQFGKICLRRDRNLHLLLFVLVCLGLDVRRIRVQNPSAYQSLFHALPQDLVEDLFRDVIVPEPPPSVLADRRRVRRLLRQIQPAEPFVRDVVVDLFFQSRLRFDPVQIPYKQHPKQYFRVNGRASVVRTIQRRAQIVDEAEIHRPVHFAQKVIFRYHLFHDHDLHLLLFLPPPFEHLSHRLVCLVYIFSTRSASFPFGSSPFSKIF